MISAIVLGCKGESGGDVEQGHEIVVRSLLWLVSAVVAGVVRDVTLAVPAGFGLSKVADHSGCELVEADDEAGRLSAAITVARGQRLLVLKAGYQPDGRIAEEIDAFIRREPAHAVTRLLAAPDTLFQRLAPDRAPTIGVLAPRSVCAGLLPPTFARLVHAGRGAAPLRTRAIRIV